MQWPTQEAMADVASAIPKTDDTDRRRAAGGEPRHAPGREARLHQGLDWTFCGPASAGGRSVQAPSPPAPGTPIDIETGALTYQQDTGLLTLAGGVDLRRGGERVKADTITYDRTTGAIATAGETLVERSGVRLIGDRALLNLETNRGQIEHVSYRFSGSANLRGTAELAELVEPSLTRYTDLVYSTCPPGDNAWSLKASKLKLDQEKGIGVARNARLRVKGIPVLYTPYLRFPIDDRRKSGLLIPTVGSSDESGFELVVPYYWNIAPNMDATLSPRYLSERGLMLGTEFRYLTRHDEGRIEAEIIPNDSKYEENGARWALSLEEEGRWLGRLSTALDFSAVSDDDYLEDFGNGLDITSTRRLLQRGSATYHGRGWSLMTALEGYQTVDPTISPAQRPYGRFPQVLFNLSPVEFAGGLVANLNAEYDYFDHNHIVHGQRLAMQPAVSLPLRRSYGHLIPSVTLNLTGYDLTDTAPGQPTSPHHSIPTVEVDGKLVFERSAELFGQAAMQTLEPRLFYLYTPYEDQSETPVFDSAELDFNFANLFRSNRFTGRDRIGDANQITTALTSRYLDVRTGEEMLRLSVGRILYFADRKVQITGPTEVTDESPVAGEFSARLLDGWRARASFEWDPAEGADQWGRRTLQLGYAGPEAKQLLNMAYRFDRGATIENRYETTDLSFRMPVSKQVEVVGRWLYSFQSDETTDAFAGIEYGQCCWKLRVLGRHFKNRPDSNGSTSVMLQLELAGLGAFGSSIDSLLQREVYGYQVD
jgi:LPS-assembly protein